MWTPQEEPQGLLAMLARQDAMTKLPTFEEWLNQHAGDDDVERHNWASKGVYWLAGRAAAQPIIEELRARCPGEESFEKLKADALELTEQADLEIADLHDAMKKHRERSEKTIAAQAKEIENAAAGPWIDASEPPRGFGDYLVRLGGDGETVLAQWLGEQWQFPRDTILQEWATHYAIINPPEGATTP